MSDDKEEKTEEPTAKKLQEAMNKGQVPSSQEVKTWFIFVSFTVFLLVAGPWFVGAISNRIANFMSMAHLITENTGYKAPISSLMSEIMLLMIAPLGTLLVAGLIGNRMQNSGTFSFEKLKPDIKKLSPISGIKKLFSPNTLVELGKALMLVTIVGVTIFFIVWPERDRLDSMVFVPLEEVIGYIYQVAIELFIGVTILITVIAALDYIWQNYQFKKNLRMTKQEVKDERKQMDGDPMVKRRLRSIRMERFSKRLRSVIPESDVVVTNPTHYAVALKYKHGEMDVPVVTAKGVDSMAQRIRKFADEFDVPIVENPPLARALYADTVPDQEIPPDQYKAVAEVISYVMKLRRSGMGHRQVS